MDKFDITALLQSHMRKLKDKPTQFNSVAKGVKKRLDNNIKKWKNSRVSTFDDIRNLPTTDSPTPKKKVLSKLELKLMHFETWKKEKEKKREQAALSKKKPFVVGIPHNPRNYIPPPPPRPMPSSSGCITRSQSSRYKTCMEKQKKHQFLVPADAKFNPPVLKNLVQLPKYADKKSDQKDKKSVHIQQKLPQENTKVKMVVEKETRTLRSKQVQPAKESGNKTRKFTNSTKLSSMSSSSVESTTVEESKVKIPIKSSNRKSISTPNNKKIPKSESSSEEKLRSPKAFDVPTTPKQIVEGLKKTSPCVTLSRGKDNARKEMKQKLDEGLLDDDFCEKEDVEYFRRQLNSEIKRMTEMCETWEKISEQMPLNVTVQELVLGAVGQARLLMSKKLQQFASLLQRCECPEPGQALVTPGDLHGFWDMVFMQIINVDMRFKKLEELRARDWVEENPVVVQKKTKAVAARKPAATSRIKDIIAAARRAKKEQPEEIPKAEESKTFEGGFFSVQSPVKSPRTPNKPTLLKAVLSSEANKSASKLCQNSASYAMLRASLISKNVDSPQKMPQNTTPLAPINLNATPAKSILKSVKKSGKKSIKVLLFEEPDKDLKSPVNGLKDLQKRNSDFVEICDKENQRRLTRQDATEERSPVMTRSRRKSLMESQEQNK